MIPKGRKAVAAQVNGKDTPFEPFFGAVTRFVLLPVPKGESVVIVKYAPVEAVAGKVTLAVKPQKGKLVVTADKTGVPSDARITLQILQSNIPIWRGDLTGSKQIIALPSGTTADNYIIQAIDQSGKILGGNTFRLAAGEPVTLHPAIDIILPAVNSKTTLKTPAAQRGFEVLSEAAVCTRQCGTVKTDAQKQFIDISTPPVLGAPYSTLGGAFELKSKRYLKIRFSGNFSKYNGFSNSSPEKMMSSAVSSVNSFFGLTLDFRTARGYTFRTLAGCGLAKVKRVSNEPALWGTGKNADMLVNISSFGTGFNASEELWLDMNAMGAPADWDGRLWLGAFWHNANPARNWKTEILESSDKLPAGASAAVAWVLKGGSEVKQTTITPPTVKTPPVIDGDGKDAVWKDAPAVENFTVLKYPLTKAATPTRVRFLRDSKNLYLLAELTSPDGAGFSVRPGLMVEKQDSIELYFRHSDSNTAFVQYILGGISECYAQYNSRHRKEGGSGALVRELAPPDFKTTVTPKATAKPKTSTSPKTTTAPKTSAPSKAAAKPSTTAKPQAAAKKSERPVFKIQIMTTNSKLNSNDKRLKGLKADYYKENGAYKYTYGASENYNEILRLKKEISGKFKDAFIIAFLNGQKINTSKAIEMFKKQTK